MSYSVLLVDGPSRGETVPVTDAHVTNVFVPISPAVDVFSFWRDEGDMPVPHLETAHYKITRIKMFGQWLLVGSVTERPSDYDLFTALASDRAKMAVIS